MKKYKELLSNTGLLTLSNFGSKILSFFLVPLYTSVLSTADYGNYDFIYTTISLLIPFLTLCIYESALRFLLDKKNDKKVVVTITFKYSILAVLIFFVFTIINKILGLVEIFNNYLLFFILLFLSSLIYTVMQNIARGMDKIKDVAISGFLNSIFMLSLNLAFLLYYKIGLNGYFLSTIISNIVAAFYLLLRLKIIKYINLKNKDKVLEKNMIEYSKPLMFNAISWWINSASDRYIVTFFCGLATNGIYSISYKIPSMLSVFQIIFNQAWGISAVKEYDSDEAVDFFSNAYSIYNFLMVVICSVLIIFVRIIAKILYMNEFYAAWFYSPFLFLSVIFGALAGFFGGIFSAAKDSKIIGITTVLGAIINVILNIVLVYCIGALGAAIATFASYFIIWVIRLIKVKKYIKLMINIKRDIIIYILLIIQCFIVMYVNNIWVLYICESVLFISILLLFYDVFIKLVKRFGVKS